MIMKQILFMWFTVKLVKYNQRLGSAGDNDQRSKCFCSNAVLCVSFTLQMVKQRMINLQEIEGPHACACHSFLVEIQTNAGYIHVMYA